MPVCHDITAAYVELLQRCCISKNLQNLRKLHVQTIKLLIDGDFFIRAKLRSGYALCITLSSESVAGLLHLRVGKWVHGYAVVRGLASDLAHCNALISMYEKFSDSPDAVAFTTILTACSHGGRIDKGKEYFAMMTERAFETFSASSGLKMNNGKLNIYSNGVNEDIMKCIEEAS
ncbi:pentatricopeptide repeat-containing protein At5g15300-like [Silene latifolia]|uniref:pentatricopeptide repeat-containing protein At5g15300-like n=1 Tax=Silene latifolia TaxID=37657 RepID=UPI003D787348